MKKVIEAIENNFSSDDWERLIGPNDKSVPTAKEGSAVATLINWACEYVDAPILILGGEIHLWNGKFYEHDIELFNELVLPSLRRLGLFVSQANNVDFLRVVAKSLGHLTKLSTYNLDLAPRGINFQDGVLFMDMKGCEFKAGHSMENVFTYCLPFNYMGERKKSEVWRPFIEQIIPEEDVREYVMASFANAIACDPMKAQRMTMLMGVGASGKSTLIDAVIATVNKKNVFQVDDLKNLTKDDSRYRMDLANHILCICGDASGNIGNKDVLKQIVSKEEISGRMLFKEVEYFTPRASLIVASNEMGFTHALGDSGISRRIDIIQFDSPVAEKDRDPFIGKKLSAPNEQREMILDMIDCVFDMQKKHGKMVRPEKLSKAMNDLMYDGDSFLSFLAWSGLEVAEKGAEGKDIEFLHQSKLRDAFTRFSIEYGNSVLGMKTLKSKCRFHGCVQKDAPARSHSFMFRVQDNDLFTTNFSSLNLPNNNVS